VALTLIWVWIFNPVYGPFNGILNALGLEQPNWFGSPTWSKPALIIMSLWGSMGGGSMLIFLAGLQGVPVELYEAAEIDGAAGMRKFLHITVPMVSPTMFFILVINMIGAFRVFTIAYVGTGGIGGGSTPPGGPAYSTTFYILHLYNNAWRYMQMGYASALGWLFIALVLVLVIAQFRLSSGWVYYEGEGKK
jgi:multiple sugar transport system permease protein